MTVWVFVAAAVTAYLVGGVNPAILLSRGLYRRDVRRFGSHNPGFTNFHRVFGGDHAWVVFLVDFAKSALMCAVFGAVFRRTCGLYRMGAAFTSLFTLLGHAYPLWHHFRGGKGVAVMFAAVWFVEWRAGAVLTVIFLVLMLTTRYMSLSVLCAAVSAPVTMAVVGTEHPAIPFLIGAAVLFMILRHRENLQRLVRGTESRFSLKPPPPGEGDEK